MNLNKVVLAGRLTAAPELKTTSSGQSVTSIRVATNRTWTDKAGAKQENVQFHAVVIWGKQAEIAATFLQKGSTVLIEGRLETREWDKKDGSKGYTTEIICENLQLGPKPLVAALKDDGTPRTLVGFPVMTDASEKAAKPEKEEPYDGEKFEPLFGDPKGEIKVEDIPF